MKKILITSPDGFIGSNLVEALVRWGYEVKAFVMYSALNSRGWLDHLRPENPKVERLWVANAKTMQLIDWQPSYGGRDGFKCGLTETAEWFTRRDNLRGCKADIYNI